MSGKTKVIHYALTTGSASQEHGLRIQGTASTIFSSGPDQELQVIAWQGDENNKVDRFDCRLLLETLDTAHDGQKL